MDDNSWLHLAAQDPACGLPAELAARDVLGARDCGWVEQMRPFIRHFAPPGGTVVDPFCGFGSTLVAAHLEGRRGLGIELEPARADLARERLRLARATEQSVVAGDILDVAAGLPPADLVLTNVPYFGCRWPGAEAGPASQFYASSTYARFLDKFHAVFAALKPVVRDGGHVIVMAENLRIGQHFVPMAWDIARILAERFHLVDERVLVYDKPRRPLDPMATGSNRAHEVALVARKAPKPIDLDDTLRCLQALAGIHPDFIVYGSFARWLLREGEAPPPSDADLLVPADPRRLAAMAAWLQDQGFQLTRWGAPVGAHAAAVAAEGAHYLRATRLRADGALCSIDLCFDDAVLAYDQAARMAQVAEGLRVLATSRPAGS